MNLLFVSLLLGVLLSNINALPFDAKPSSPLQSFIDILNSSKRTSHLVRATVYRATDAHSYNDNKPVNPIEYSQIEGGVAQSGHHLVPPIYIDHEKYGQKNTGLTDIAHFQTPGIVSGLQTPYSDDKSFKPIEYSQVGVLSNGAVTSSAHHLVPNPIYNDNKKYEQKITDNVTSYQTPAIVGGNKYYDTIYKPANSQYPDAGLNHGEGSSAHQDLPEFRFEFKNVGQNFNQQGTGFTEGGAISPTHEKLIHNNYDKGLGQHFDQYGGTGLTGGGVIPLSHHKLPQNKHDGFIQSLKHKSLKDSTGYEKIGTEGMHQTINYPHDISKDSSYPVGTGLGYSNEGLVSSTPLGTPFGTPFGSPYAPHSNVDHYINENINKNLAGENAPVIFSEPVNTQIDKTLTQINGQSKGSHRTVFRIKEPKVSLYGVPVPPNVPVPLGLPLHQTFPGHSATPGQTGIPIQSGIPLQLHIPPQSDKVVQSGFSDNHDHSLQQNLQVQSDVPVQSSVSDHLGFSYQQNLPVHQNVHVQSGVNDHHDLSLQQNFQGQLSVPLQSGVSDHHDLSLQQNFQGQLSVPLQLGVSDQHGLSFKQNIPVQPGLSDQHSFSLQKNPLFQSNVPVQSSITDQGGIVVQQHFRDHPIEQWDDSPDQHIVKVDAVSKGQPINSAKLPPKIGNEVTTQISAATTPCDDPPVQTEDTPKEEEEEEEVEINITERPTDVTVEAVNSDDFRKSAKTTKNAVKNVTNVKNVVKIKPKNKLKQKPKSGNKLKKKTKKKKKSKKSKKRKQPRITKRSKLIETKKSKKKSSKQSSNSDGRSKNGRQEEPADDETTEGEEEETTETPTSTSTEGTEEEEEETTEAPEEEEATEEPEEEPEEDSNDNGSREERTTSRPPTTTAAPTTTATHSSYKQAPYPPQVPPPPYGPPPHGPTPPYPPPFPYPPPHGMPPYPPPPYPHPPHPPRPEPGHPQQYRGPPYPPPYPPPLYIGPPRPEQHKSGPPYPPPPYPHPHRPHPNDYHPKDEKPYPPPHSYNGPPKHPGPYPHPPSHYHPHPKHLDHHPPPHPYPKNIGHPPYPPKQGGHPPYPAGHSPYPSPHHGPPHPLPPPYSPHNIPKGHLPYPPLHQKAIPRPPSHYKHNEKFDYQNNHKYSNPVPKGNYLKDGNYKPIIYNELARQGHDHYQGPVPYPSPKKQYYPGPFRKGKAGYHPVPHKHGHPPHPQHRKDGVILTYTSGSPYPPALDQYYRPVKSIEDVKQVVTEQKGKPRDDWSDGDPTYTFIAASEQKLQRAVPQDLAALKDGNKPGAQNNGWVGISERTYNSFTFPCKGKVDGFYADVNYNCEVYYKCKDNGIDQKLKCPSGMRFNKTIQSCDFGHQVMCGQN